MTWSGYLAWMAATLAGTVIASGLFTSFIDPLGIVGAPRVTALNAKKPLLDHHHELARWRAAIRLCPKAGVFGNSRAEIGFDPEHPAFAARGVDGFNHAIPGTSINTASHQLEWLAHAGCSPRLVVLGVEFFDFLGGDAPQPEEPRVHAAPQLDASVLAETVFSLTAIRDAMATVALQHSNHPALTTPRGFNPLHHYELEVARSGHNAMFRQRAQESLKYWARKPRRLATATGGASADAMALETFLHRASAEADEVHLVIYPYHAQIRLMIERTELTDLYHQWKRELLAAAQRASGRRAKVRLWDFSALGDETLESIPLPGDRRSRMTNYWEAGHFKKELGDRMLSQMLQGQGGFGVLLEPAMLERWLRIDAERAASLLATPSPLRAEVDRLLPGR